MASYPFNYESLIEDLAAAIDEAMINCDWKGWVIVYKDKIDIALNPVNNEYAKSPFQLKIPMAWNGYSPKEWNKYAQLLFEARKELFDRCRELNTSPTQNATLFTEPSDQKQEPKNKS